MNVEKGITGYEDPKHPYVGKEVTPHQKSLLIELGHKISTVKFYFILGSLLIFKTRILYLSCFCCSYVYHYYFLN